MVAVASLVAAGANAEEPHLISAPAPPSSKAPQNFGTTNTVYDSIGEWEFAPPTNAWTWGDTAGNQPLKFPTQAGIFFNAAAHIPNGALLTSLEFDYCDDNASQDASLQLINVDYLNNAIFNLGTVTSSGTPGCTFGTFDVSQYGITVDALNQRLLLQVSFGSSVDSTTRFAGAIIGYKLQVSPAPGVPTFNDVPLSDFGFQYIEALAASGITGGCGGGNFCPDSPVTRRQMAIFIAKALGLSY
jgi:hypothetical protein